MEDKVIPGSRCDNKVIGTPAGDSRERGYPSHMLSLEISCSQTPGPTSSWWPNRGGTLRHTSKYSGNKESPREPLAATPRIITHA